MDLIGVAILVGSVVSFYKMVVSFPRESRVRRAIRAVQSTALESTPSNQVAKVVGYIEGLAEPLIAPLTGAECVCYELTIEEFIPDDQEKRWVMLVQDTNCQNFILRQSKEEALIKVRYANVYLLNELEVWASTMTTAPRRVRDFLEQRGEFTTGRERTIRFREWVLATGHRVSVLGYALREPYLQSEPVGYRDTGTRLTFAHQEEHDLYLSNDPATFL